MMCAEFTLWVLEDYDTLEANVDRADLNSSSYRSSYNYEWRRWCEKHNPTREEQIAAREHFRRYGR
jgi:hypothetical protein